MDQVGNVDDLSEGAFRLPFPPSSGTTGVAHEQRSGMSDDRHKLTSLAYECPRRGWSMPRIEENSGTFYFIMYAKKLHIESENNEYMFTCMF
jgi:hypothetical protein